MKRSILPIIFLLVFSISFLSAQQDAANIWSIQSSNQFSQDELRIPVSQSELYQLDMEALQAVLAESLPKSAIQSKADYVEIEIPVFENGFQKFGIFETPVMEAGLQAKYPEIRTYTGQGIDNPRQIIKLDVGPKGFHAMVFSNKQTFVIEPAYENDLTQYITFQKNDVIVDEDHAFTCGVSEVSSSSLNDDEDVPVFAPTGEELRTYRLALATTGEYASFHGGTKPLTLAAMATVMNRVNGIYERDLTITMIMIDNTDTLIYLNGATDPYTNNNGGAMLNQNNTTCNNVIGSANYDIGHVFSTGGGGIAGLGVVCGGNKGWGVTGLGSPIGDVFSVDYVSHEMGHQFSGNHTFNSCGGQGPQPYEPGSGVTVMAYAGICGNTNIASNSIDQFHVASFDEIINFSQNGSGDNCAVITPTGNTPPTVDAGPGGFHIPFQTPFELTGSAEDLEGDSLTYCWEQFDLGPQTHPNTANGTAPLFRSWLPESHPTRIFPRIQDLVNNTTVIGELLPQFGRIMRFRMTVRDNVAGGGGVDYDQINFEVNNNSGPFLVTSPNGGQNWNVGFLETVTWDVAGSDLAPVNCSEVNIFLSEDGGFTYPHLVALNLPNTGSAIIQVPDVIGNQIRMKIKAANNVFFDISNQNFTIEPSTEPDYVYATATPSQTICSNETVEYEIMIDTILGYSDPVNLSMTNNPAGTSVAFSANDIVPPGNTTLSVTVTGAITPGSYDITVLLTSNSVVKELPLTLNISQGAPAIATLTSPTNGAASIQINSLVNWEDVPDAASYTVEVSLTADFTDIVYTESGVTESLYNPFPDLTINTVYFWRVRAEDAICNLVGDWSSVYSFQTIQASVPDPNFELNGDEVMIGTTLVIETNNISGDCVGSTTDLEYTITGLPTSGTLFLNSNPVAIGTIFTQADIDNGLLTYVNDGLDLDPDQFEFILTCENGAYIGGLVFNITVVETINTADIPEVIFSLFPNPVDNFFELRLNEQVSAGYELMVVDMLGRVLHKQAILSGTNRVETQLLSAGVYSCQIVSNGVVLGEEKFVVMR